MISIQYWISLVLFLGMIEATVLHEHFLLWNELGTAQAAGTMELIGILFGVAKRTLSRVLILMISMGYGMVKPTLGQEMKQILLLGLTYAVMSYIYDTQNSDSLASDLLTPLDKDAYTFTVMVMAAADSIFYIWTFSSINELIMIVETKKQVLKAVLYRRFRNVLGLSLGLCIAWGAYSTLFVLDDVREVNWELRWAVDAMYEVIYLFIFIAVAFLFAPSKNSLRYSYSELSTKDTEEEDGSGVDRDVELTSMKSVATTSPRVRRVNNGENEALDHEYGGRLDDREDPTLPRAAGSAPVSPSQQQHILQLPKRSPANSKP